MDYFARLDVSVKDASVCIVDEGGERSRCPADGVLRNAAYRIKRIGSWTAVAMAVQCAW
jgi:hypothetical protein